MLVAVQFSALYGALISGLLFWFDFLPKRESKSAKNERERA